MEFEYLDNEKTSSVYKSVRFKIGFNERNDHSSGDVVHLYRDKLANLQSKFDPREVADKWLSFQAAKSCCSSIRRARNPDKATATSNNDLVLTNKQSFININNKE
ncbi:unnamed protein product [Brachionus calyciflorus]|uniref:Uncharacterized protein n=1 Tax=Brachionus calyciflorus TaxID=104777 RepID=A0A814FY04_9BILA|nr:unnamed protein product [Brachionus calyciflorus]